MIKGFWAIPTLFMAAAFVSCGSSKKAKASAEVGEGKVHERVACAGLIKASSAPRLDWIMEENSVLDNITTLAKPDGYKVYSLDTNQAKKFFKASKDTSLSIVMPLPAPLNCRVYWLSVADVMQKKLAEKYPDLVALKGTDQQGASDLRLNYDGRWVKAQVIAEGKTYMINPVRNNGKIYYMVYARSDSKEVKEPFEEQGVKTTK